MKTLLTGIIAMLITSVALASGNLKVNIATNDSELAVVEISNVEMVH